MPLIGCSPKPGDLIEFYRPVYQHWGIYVGDDYVVHLTDLDGWSSMCSIIGGKALVKKDHIEKVANGSYYTVNNKYDQRACPYPRTKIVSAALKQVGKWMDYNVTHENCEHFVTELRYGESFSDQVVTAGVAAGVAGATLAIGVIAGLLIYGTRNKRQKQ